MKLFPGLPLLRRELIEISNRRRTYLVRVIAATVLLIVMYFAYERAMSSRRGIVFLNTPNGIMPIGGGIAGLGIGDDIVREIMPFLFGAVWLIMPALACTALTTEKEGNTMGNLLLTRLRPSVIVLEKLGSRLIPMLTILCVSVPMLVYTYTLGGVDALNLGVSVWLLFCECLLMASIALMCSAWFPTTVGSFIGSYFLVVLFAIMTLALGVSSFLPSAIWYQYFSDRGMQRLLWALTQGGNDGGILPSWLYAIAQSNGAVSGWLGRNPALVPLYLSLKSLLAVAFFLMMARLFVVRRAFVTQSSFLLKIFKAVDSFFKKLNERTTGGIEIIPDNTAMPLFDPIAWRERTKKSLGQVRYLFRILVCLEGPTLFICTATAIYGARNSFEGLFVLQALAWFLAIVVISVKSATLFSSERSRQTLEALLATPLSSTEILRQKITGIRRLMIVMALPAMTVAFTFFLLEINTSSLASFLGSMVLPLATLAAAGLATFLMLYLVAWQAAAIGMWMKTQTKAVMSSIAMVIIVWGTPLFLADQFSRGYFSDFLTLLSPAGMVQAIARQYEFAGKLRFDRARFEDFEILHPIVMYVIGVSLVVAQIVLLVYITRHMAPKVLNRIDYDRPERDGTVGPAAIPSVVPEGATV